MDIDIPGGVLHVEVAGGERGPAMMLLHGFAQDSSTWDGVVAALGSDRRLVLVDLIGHGRSSRHDAAGPYALDRVVESLEIIRRHLGEEAVHLVGYSMGGRIALTYASRYPGSVASLVIESASFGPRDAREREESLARDRALAERLRSSSIERFVEYWETLSVFAGQEHLAEAQRVTRLANDPLALARIVEGCGQGRMDDLLGWACSAPMPLVYFTGARDSRYHALAGVVAGCGVSVIEFDAGHDIHLERPGECTDALRDFHARVG